MTTETYEILAIKYGEFAARTRFESFIAADDHDAPPPHRLLRLGDPQRQPHHPRRRGFDEAEGAKRGRKIARTPAAALEMIGMPAGKLEQVIVSHLHYDHAGTLGASPRRASICRRPRWHTPPGPACATTTCAIPSPPTTCARWCATSIRAASTFHDGDGGGGAGRHRAQGRRPQPRPAVRAGDDGERAGRARLRQLALLRELREGQSLPHHRRHRRRARRLQPAARSSPPRRGISCPATTRWCCSAIPRSTARRKASCTGSTLPGSTAEAAAASARRPLRWAGLCRARATSCLGYKVGIARTNCLRLGFICRQTWGAGTSVWRRTP